MEDLQSYAANKQVSLATPVQVQLPEDIIAEILIRLPVRILVKFKCVCKSWFKLLTDPIFTHRHLIFNSIKQIILSNYLISSTFLSLPTNPSCNSVLSTQQLHFPFPDRTPFCLKGHCNGLLCIATYQGTIILWNPSISRYRALPTPNFKLRYQVLGIGYDSSINDYKIVRVPSHYSICKRKNYPCKVEVLSLKSNSWRKLSDTNAPSFWMEYYEQSLSLHGSIYWLTLTDITQGCFTLILRFDLTREKFSHVPNPPNDTEGNLLWIGDINHSLCTFHCNEQSHFDIWATQDDSNWEKLITISMIDDPVLSPLCYAPLCFTETGELLMSIRGYGLAAYDQKDQSYRKFVLTVQKKWLRETLYTESLVFPHEPLDQTCSSRQISSSYQPLDQTHSAPGAFSKLWLPFSNTFWNNFSCRAKSW